MESKKKLWIGTRVRVQPDHPDQHLRGRIGTIKQRYRDISYAAAFEVWFPDGQTQLFMDYELEVAA